MALRSYEAVIDSQYRRFSRRRRTLLMDAAREGAERRAALAAMDRAWADHLALAADLRQGVHLNVYGGRDPWREYLRIATEAFEAMMEGLEGGGPRDPGRALSRPDQRWTYAIEENLLPSWRLGKGPGAPGSLAKFILAPVLRLFRR